VQIAVASGKGGTGKTTIATSLALSLASLAKVRYVDCDVEAPNGHLFLKPEFSESTPAVIRIPLEKTSLFSRNCVTAVAAARGIALKMPLSKFPTQLEPSKGE